MNRSISELLNDKSEKGVFNIMINDFFKTIIREEYDIIRTIRETKGLSKEEAEKLLELCSEKYNKLDKKKLFECKKMLIEDISAKHDLMEFFKIKIDNNLYKLYKSIDNYLNKKGNIREILNDKDVIIRHLTEEKKSLDERYKEYYEQDDNMKKLIFEMMVKKFNDKYKNLNGAQKRVIRNYIFLLNDNTKLSEFVNEEYKRAFKRLKENINKTDLPKNISIKILALEESLPKVNPFNVNDEHFLLLLNYYQLINEIQKNKNSK
ncbi:MAG: hypothetical protein IRZ03_13205 [Acidobacterium ailaaui]|nr:hypothetical protein [Pseudacidobacterium ailaaui]